MRLMIAWLGFLLLTNIAVWSQGIDPEEFLAPKRVTNFIEQKLAASIKDYKRGNISDALFIQRKLAQYYAGLGDSTSANLCNLRVKAAELILHPAPSAKTQPGAILSENRQPSPGRLPNQPKSVAHSELKGTPSSWSGRYYGTVAGTLHKWDFNADGTFMHQIVASGGGTSIRNLERGVFLVSGNLLELTIAKHVSAYTTPAVQSQGRQTTQIGANTEAKTEKHEMKIRLLGNNGDTGIELDGETYKVRSWN